ncbi:F-box/LRR-repeat protein 2-like [Aphidius gifuensis]|uniref:F-box/LRR-repeat protein 2-like n=1 Tax=Aphidius gifuensis TaxID=684658 RepID=UPI001CDD5D87|nr:F-box/LRR-repeat protein 2-like [Aphidius gifuensis]
MGTGFDAKNLSTKVLETIFCTCKNLKHLDIPRGPYDLAKIPLKKWMNFQNLEYLGIFCNEMPDVANTIVNYCKNLKHLEIKSFFMMDTRLEIDECIIEPAVDGGPFSSRSVLHKLSKLQYLEHLCLCTILELEDSTIIAVANNCKYLKSLDIQACYDITETALAALTNLENLEKLVVSFLDIITDSFLIKLKGLKEFHCEQCDKITDAGIIQFIKNNPDLEILNVYSADNITINMIIAADQATENRTNGIILHINVDKRLMKRVYNSNKSIITSQWLVVDKLY